MKQRIEIIVLLLFVLFQATSSVAQIQKASGKVFRVENRTYISQNDKLYEIDEKVVLAKLRKGKVRDTQGTVPTTILEVSDLVRDCPLCYCMK